MSVYRTIGPLVIHVYLEALFMIFLFIISASMGGGGGAVYWLYAYLLRKFTLFLLFLSAL